ncbi:P-loop containing nucleoside triphosphate hydrolase protein [Chaetomium fimeti]|uniref:P-loop containing nucleoside triphosphate hydrolase protein n=1 Tax=Chaetomium fimeti TaxID=1854472 RepID=A0AAE0HDE1_9PEZI|nr:P-loop containing nucleoside triphosphate hydrolase protein [Chaetomium fimeti]
MAADSKPPEMPIYLRTAINQNPNFVGRSKIIDQIDRELLPDNPNPNHSPSRLRSFALCGFGGLGKTQIATFYAFERTNAFDAIFWIQASDVDKLYNGFRDMAESLGLVNEGDEGDMVVSRDKVLQWLCHPRKQQPPTAMSSADTTAGASRFAKWLIIFDDADNIDIVSEFWPSTTHGAILVTSRDPLAKTSDLAMEGIDLPPMTDSECALLLQKQVAETNDPDASRAALSLVTRLGNIPLAVSQIATQIRRKFMTIEEYLGRYGEGSLLGELNKVKALPPKERYRFTVSTVWRFEDFSPQAISLMRVMAFMDPDAVTERILRQDVEIPEGSLVGEVEHTCSYPKLDLYVDARAELLRTSLTSRNRETKTLGWYKQVQEVVRERMTRDELHIHYQVAIDLLFRAWEFAEDRSSRESFRRKRCEEVLPHVQTILSAYDLAVRESGLPLEKARQLVQLLQETGWYLVQGAQYMPALSALELAVKICNDHGDGMKDLLADTLFLYARCGEKTNMDLQTVIGYCLQGLAHRIKNPLSMEYCWSRRRGVLVARSHFIQAIDIFKRSPYHKPELARALYKISCFYNLRKAMCGLEAAEAPDRERAVEMYYELCPLAAANERLGEKDFDSRVRFWSR